MRFWVAALPLSANRVAVLFSLFLLLWPSGVLLPPPFSACCFPPALHPLAGAARNLRRRIQCCKL